MGAIQRWLGMLNNDNAQASLVSPISLRWRMPTARKFASRAPIAFERKWKAWNNRHCAGDLERVFQSEQSEKLPLAGVMLLIRRVSTCRTVDGRDITIDANVIIEGHGQAFATG